ENHKDYGESDDITILAIRQPDPEPPMIELSLEDVADPAMTQVIQLDQIAATELLRAKQAAEAAARQAHIDLAHKGQVLKRAMKELHTTREQNATLGQQLRTIGEQFAALQAEAASLRAAAANLPAAPAGDPLAAIEKDVQSLGEQWVKIVEGLATASLANEDISSRQQGIRSLLTTLEQPAGTPDPSEARRREIVTKHASELSAFEERENIKTHRREIARLTEEINLANKPDQTEQRDFLQKLVQTHQDAIALEKASLDQAQAAELAAIDEEPRKRATLITRQQKALAELEKKAEIAKKQVEDLTAEKTALATRARDLLARLQLLGQPLKSLQAPETKKE
ncbi:MAG TPA: hypothetical protein VMT55_04450, partial [Candidatus Sulfotelmatobacter sp.]|nr:hypothetical protein [Candidatus Sulfotelmatobacter sp.]